MARRRRDHAGPLAVVTEHPRLLLDRLSGFHGTNVDETIADDISDGPVVVDIAPTDIGFSTKRCGTWTKVA